MLDIFDDPQLVAREHFVPLDHPEMGVLKYDELGFKLRIHPPDCTPRRRSWGSTRRWC